MLYRIALMVAVGSGASQMDYVPAKCLVIAGTTLELATTRSITSKSAQPGDTFGIELIAPLALDGRQVLPVHTTGVGQVVHAARQDMGKTGELILAARYLIVGDQKLLLRSFRINATGDRTTKNTYLGAGTVTTELGGTEVEVPAGSMALARVSIDTLIPCNPALEE